MDKRARSQPDNGVVSLRFWILFRLWNLEFSVAVQEETSIFKIIMIDDRYSVVKARIYMLSLYSILIIMFQVWKIFKTLALEHSAEKWPFSTGGGGCTTAPTPLPLLLATGLIKR